jgi:hypothetical protein
VPEPNLTLMHFKLHKLQVRYVTSGSVVSNINSNMQPPTCPNHQVNKYKMVPFIVLILMPHPQTNNIFSSALQHFVFGAYQYQLLPTTNSKHP